MVPERPLPVGAPSAEELYEITRGKKTIVLLRVTMTLDKEPLKSPADRLEFGLGSIYSPNLIPVIPQVVSEASKNDGWVYFVLSPGTYNFWALPPSSDPQHFRYQIEVPSDSRVLYAGTLSINCTKAESDACSKPVLIRDERGAQSLAEASFRDVGPLKFSSMRRYEPPTNEIPRELFPMAMLGGSSVPPTVTETTAPYT